MDQYSLTDESTIALISDSAPRALSAYFLCLHRSDPEGNCTFSKSEIIKEYKRSWTKFKNDIRVLSYLYLIDSEELTNQITVHVVRQEKPEWK